MKDLGEASRILGMDILRDKDEETLTISQEVYVKKILEKYDMKDCKSSSIPMDLGGMVSTLDCPQDEEERQEMRSISYANVVGSLMYVMVSSRPDRSLGCI